MGNRQVNDCSGPEITEKEIKELSFTGFTIEELTNMGTVENNQYKSKTKKSKTKKSKTYAAPET